MQETMTTEWPATLPRRMPSLTASRLTHPATTIVFAICFAALTFLTFGDKLSAVWHTGAFFDTDDALRLVQVRALLAGQAWFDMTVNGMNPPHGVFMHWSRIVDIPLVCLIKLFALMTNDITAERIARLTFPFALLVGLYLGMARLAALTIGSSARIPTMAATVLSGNGIAQFVPGRVHHLVPQVVVLVVILGAALASLETSKARLAALAGALVGLSLSMSLENLPSIICLSAGLTLVWVRHGAPAAPMMRAYAVGLAVGLPAFFLLTVGPSRYGLPVCDAFGAAHLGAGLIGALGCGILSLSALRLGSQPSRLAAAVAVALTAGAFVGIAYPNCLHDPFATVDPLVREIWLDNVEEALPFRRMLQNEPEGAWTAIVPVIVGIVACLLAAVRSKGVQRERFLILTAVVAVGLAMTFWQVRVFTSITAIVLCGGLYWVCAAQDWCRERGRESLASLSTLLAFPFTATAVAVALAAVPNAPHPSAGAVGEKDKAFVACLSPKSFAPLETLAPSSVVAPVDLGSYLLAHTDLSVFAASYHRNNDGTRFGLELMLAPEALAQQMARARNVGYVLTCPGLNETRRLGRRNTDSLAADLVAGRTPVWLAPVALQDTPFHVYRVVAKP